MTNQKREVFVLEKRGVPYRSSIREEDIQKNFDAGARLGIPEGEERVVRYVPESEPRAWILCSERMPESGEDVWFFLPQNDPRPGWWSGGGNCRWIAANDVGGAGWTKRSATHWMPRIVDRQPDPPHV